MSNADKALIANKLDNVFGVITLLVDGYYLYVSTEKQKQKLLVAVYCNGFIKGADALIYCPTKELDSALKQKKIARRFYYLKQMRGKILVKSSGRYKQKIGNLDAWSAVPYFPSPKAFVNHMYKHNEIIKIITQQEYDEGVAALRVVA